jgi:hypothetical protein
MTERPSRLGFVRLGEIPATDLDLPRSRALSLELLECWRRFAGDAVSRHTIGIAVRRGVLEVPVSEPSWARVLRTLLPGLARKVATELPVLGVHSWRLRVEGTRRRDEPTRISTSEEIAPPESGGVVDVQAKPSTTVTESARTGGGSPATHLRAIAELYLDRRKKPSPTVKT